MDSQIIKELWNGFLEISNDLQKDNEVVSAVRDMIQELPKEKLVPEVSYWNGQRNIRNGKPDIGIYHTYLGCILEAQ